MKISANLQYKYYLMCITLCIGGIIQLDADITLPKDNIFLTITHRLCNSLPNTLSNLTPPSPRTPHPPNKPIKFANRFAVIVRAHLVQSISNGSHSFPPHDGVPFGEWEAPLSNSGQKHSMNDDKLMRFAQCLVAWHRLAAALSFHFIRR